MRANVASERSYYNIAEAAALLGVSRVSVRRWIRSGKLPVIRLGRRRVRINREDLERAFASIGPNSPRPEPPQLPGTSIATGARPAWMDRPASDLLDPPVSEHFVQFYETDAFLLDAVGDYIGRALREGDTAFAIATRAHLAGLEKQLEAYGVDPAAARARGQYQPIDAAEALSKCLVGDMPSPERFMEIVGHSIAQAAGQRRVRVFGEMVALAMAEGKHAATIGIEGLWNELQRKVTFSLFCAYPMDSLGNEANARLLDEVCAAHSRVIPAESYMRLPTQDDRLRALAILQQKARWLEAEIEERKRIEDRLRAQSEAELSARQAAEDALRLRDEFLSIAAHELKTPITSLLGHAQLIIRRLSKTGQQPEPERLTQELQAIADQAGRLSRLVNQLLDISRLEAGKLILDRQPTNLTSLAEQVVTGAQAGSSRHVITLEAPPMLEAMADPLRLEQVLTNFLDNAIKYSPEGGTIAVVLSKPSSTTVQIAVRDRGLGIPLEQREQIFERFHQAHGNGHMSGLGLGLYISRQIAELHGGEIRAEFPADGGTQFVLELPIVAADLRPHQT